MSRKQKEILQNILFYGLLVVICFYLLFPFYWAIVSSFKSSSDIFAVPVQYFPTNPTIEPYQKVYANGDFMKGLLNSTIVSFSVTALSLSIGAFAAYALGRLPFRGKNTILYTILAMTMFPSIAIVGSLFTFIRNPCVIVALDCSEQLPLFNTKLALVLTYLIFTLPFTTWVLTNFFKSLPSELEQAAMVDGATPFQTFYMILLPLTMPALITTGLLAFILAWNEFLFAMTFTLDFQARTVQPAIAFFSGQDAREIPWNTIMAASVIVTVPLIVMVLFFQRRIVDGLTAGAVKG
ncbi:carbohydrate ABC transporter permease [Anaerolineales bacterium HSG25]|nr:carbohydrate ABC transporter permease [Anaerolineales bacterium HSG25]